MQWSSPLASFGLSRLPASIEPSVLACAYDIVYLIDEQDYPAFGFFHLVEDSLEPFLELASVLGARYQGAHVKGKDGLVFEALRHIAVQYPLGQPLYDGGLADARLADEHRVVLGPAGKYLYCMPYLGCHCR